MLHQDLQEIIKREDAQLVAEDLTEAQSQRFNKEFYDLNQRQLMDHLTGKALDRIS